MSFPESAPVANPVFYRTYSRLRQVQPLGETREPPVRARESWLDVCQRTLEGLRKLGKLTEAEAALIDRYQRSLQCLTSGRWLWVGGTPWLENPANYSGAYNCTSTNITDWESFGLLMDLAMQGSGTGAVLEPKYINQLPVIRNKLNVQVVGTIGATPKEKRREETEVLLDIGAQKAFIFVGDSRRGWVKSYQTVLELAADRRFAGEVDVVVDVSDVRPAGEPLKGFGGVANPVKLPGLYERCAKILNRAIGRKLTSVECCLLIDEAAVCVVAGNIRRCLPEDALVHTIRGLVPIKDVQVGDLVQTPIGFRRVVQKFDQGVQEITEIETNATFPRATLNHRVAVLADAEGGIKWKYVVALEPNDRLIHNTQVIPGIVTSLPPDTTAQRPKQSRTAKSITIPDLTPDVAWLIGFTHGNGYVALGRNKYGKPYGRVEWAMNSAQIELSQKIQQKIDRVLALFGVTATRKNSRTENTAKVICSSIRLAEYFHQHIKQPNCPLEVPQWILQATVEIRAAYLAGLMDSDGAVNNRPPHLLTSIYRKFSRQVGVLLSSLGIPSRLKILTPTQEKWQVKYNLTIPACKKQYNSLIAPYSIKGAVKEGLKMYGFTIPGEMMRSCYTYSEMRKMGFNGAHDIDANYERYIEQSDVDMDIPVTFKGLGVQDYVPTYDLEVEEAHCFYCDGYLTHNSAGMRQGASEDEEFANAKANLWQQDEQGNWRIDPDRDALRMSNHTRVFHRKPTLEETIEAVRKQYYSGEGAIQWAGEAVARSNADILFDLTIKQEFLKAYTENRAREWLQVKHPTMPEVELNHRLQRYGLNPCHSGDTLVATNLGLVPIAELVGKKFQVLVDLRAIGLQGTALTDAIAFPSGVKTTYQITLANGMQMRCTDNHQHLTNRGWVATRELTPEHRILIQKGEGEFGVGTISVEQAQMLGWLYGDGSIYQHRGRLDAVFYINQVEFANAFPVLSRAVRSITGYEPSLVKGVYTFHTGARAINEFLEKIKFTTKQSLPLDFLCQSREVIVGFLQGIFSADGAVNVAARHIDLVSQSLTLLRQIQLLLLNLGIRSSIREKQKPNSPGITYYLKDGTQKISSNRGSWRLLIYRAEAKKFAEKIGFPLSEQKQYKLQEFVNWQSSRCYSDEVVDSWFSSAVVSVTEWTQENVFDLQVPFTNSFIANGCITHNCGEILGSDFHCNLAEVHLNQINPNDRLTQREAFTAGALAVASLLNHKFVVERYQRSRELDPIVGVSFTGLFDFFVHLFGVDWLRWWAEGRPSSKEGEQYRQTEREYLTFWRQVVHEVVWDYCDRHGLKRPNRCTTVQPAGTKSLLTNASPGWHPPKAARYIRRITFRKDDPVALACLDYGYNIVPSQSDKDEQGNLLNDPFDPRCTEWLVEIPVEVPWANLPGADEIDIAKFSALAQFDFYMQVQKFYTTHNTSATIELRESEIEPLARRIYEAIQNDEGYISAALLARFDDHQTFPRLPFEPIDKATYDRLVAEVLARRKTDDFHAALAKYDRGVQEEAGPAPCDSDKCLR
ncbi:MAG: ribonucleoside-triphosphate reductase, adenosylcobalamin-dependent [Pseudanabaenaceae cyanobacterium SKYGB_i_bin29]|nr:ribonucleoside-triphosphate reductase, adenosylcobalamin-dependent [Pseudanabaenaceae cyanobacterium SKYG29]MDW8421472.1 ribonucleoside-triphosphate reductase, adenosylcobalamin-dependent [Pseudanabaenaceae cyanobacterium SKYGB_i_bin29]